jgi:hypothetical protein
MIDFEANLRSTYFFVGFLLLTSCLFEYFTIGIAMPSRFMTIVLTTFLVSLLIFRRCYRVSFLLDERLVNVYTIGLFQKKEHRIGFEDLRWEYRDEVYNRGSKDKKLFLFDRDILIASFFRDDFGWDSKKVEELVQQLEKLSVSRSA